MKRVKFLITASLASHTPLSMHSARARAISRYLCTAMIRVKQCSMERVRSAPYDDILSGSDGTPIIHVSPTSLVTTGSLSFTVASTRVKSSKVEACTAAPGN